MRAMVQLLRPRQWTKNGLCFAGAIFSGNAFNTLALTDAALTAAVFCLASSAVYIFNDLLDRDRDRQHPRKRLRPIASGQISTTWGSWLNGLLLASALTGAWVMDQTVFACIVAYVLLNAAYSLRLKEVPILDVLSIAFGFVLRLLAGIYVVGETPTAWITLCTFFMALFLAVAKRRAELSSFSNEYKDNENSDTAKLVEQRPVFGGYSLSFLDTFLVSAANMTVVSYALFTVAGGRNPSLVATLPIVYYAILHYQRKVMIDNGGEEPESVLMKDPHVFLSIAAWLAIYLAIDYSDVKVFL